jgi:2-polyprenyl-3-methyl-5-hydroxy-6-metoxy-1,4-benzoquinol methylase
LAAENEYLTYGGTFGRIRRIYFARILDRLALPPGAAMLDYGCGPGDFLLVAREKHVAATGIDASPRSVRLASERGLDVLCGGTTELLARPERFDAILAQSVLEHVPDPVEFANTLCRLLKPGGALVLSAPTPGPFFWDDPTHIRPYTPKSFEILAQLADLRCEYLGYVFAFLCGVQIRAPLLFPIMNVVPASLGSNLIAFLRKPAAMPPAQ